MDVEQRARELLAAEYSRAGGFADPSTESCAVRAIIAALTPQWQPIESAPKDVSTFLVGEFYFADGACVYKECSTAFRNKAGRVYCQDENVTPTHWMPLPAPPEVPDGRG